MTNELTKVQRFSELSPTGGKFSYLLSDEGRVYASARSWSRALNVPEFMEANFETGLARKSIFLKDAVEGLIEMVYGGVAVYRWHAVAAQLRSFDSEFLRTGYVSRPPAERQQLEKFHEGYERLLNWGYSLQERAIAAIIKAKTAPPPAQGTAVTSDVLVDVISRAIAPRIHEHDEKLQEHHAAIVEIKEAVPALRNPQEYISVKQAIQEQGLDGTVMPLHPVSNENLSGLTGQMLKKRRAEQGKPIVARLDGGSIATPMNTYRREAIYSVIQEIISNRQDSLF
jgi:hypothetical protein